MLTAHKPSFPTCLLHPRGVHLLCHLDSPSTASPPYLGLQEHTGPEVSGLYGSYRDFFQEFSSPSVHSLTWRSRSQANKPHAVQHCVVTTTTENTDNRFSKRFSCHKIISRDDFGAGFTHRLAQFFPNNQGFFHSNSTKVILVQEMCSWDCLERMQTHSSG
jgi:hypothetical protein